MSLDERADALDKKLAHNDIDASITVLVHDARLRRRQIIGLTISIIFDIILTIAFAILSIQARDTAINVKNSQATIISSCQTGNEFRTTEAALWNHILALQPVMTDLTPEQQTQRDKTVADFQTYLKTTFAPRNCNDIIKD